MVFLGTEWKRGSPLEPSCVTALYDQAPREGQHSGTMLTEDFTMNVTMDIQKSGPCGSFAEYTDVPKSKGAPKIPTSSSKVWVLYPASGGGLRAAVSSGFLMAGPAAPLPNDPDSQGVSSIGQDDVGEVLTLSKQRSQQHNWIQGEEKKALLLLSL